MPGIGLPSFGPKHSPYSYYKYRTSDIAAVGTTFNIFGYNALRAENHLPNDENLSTCL